MERAAAVAIGIGLILLAVIGVFTGADSWLVAADVLGAVAAGVVAVVVHQGDRGKVAVGLPVVAAMSLMMVVLSAATARATTWLTVATGVAALAFAFVAWMAMPVRRPSARTHPTGSRRV